MAFYAFNTNFQLEVDGNVIYDIAENNNALDIHAKFGSFR